MMDVWMLGLLAVYWGLCVLLVQGLERLEPRRLHPETAPGERP